MKRTAAPYGTASAPPPTPFCHVQISSTSGTHGNVGQINYSAAKSSVVGMTKTIAKEWGPFGVRANTVVSTHRPPESLP